MNLNLGDTRSIIDVCKAKGVLRNQCAYVLATTYHETAHTMKPIYERGAKAYFSKYEPGTKIGKNLGNTTKGDGFLYRGRGFTQITGRANYLKAGNKLKIDLIGNPDLALNPKTAAQILVIGMIEGWFTGKKLSAYITTGKSDFVGARRIINGTDKAALIAGYAKQYDSLLEANGYGDAPKQPAKPPAPRPVAVDLTVKQVNSVMHLGSKGDFVKTLQENLNELGYPHLDPDGVFGPDTDANVKAFQKDARLDLVDGWAGPATVGAISKELEKRKTAPKIEAAGKVVDAAAGTSSLGGFSKTEIVAAVAGVSGTANAVNEGVDAVNTTTSSFMDLVSTVGPWVLLALVLAGGAAFIIYDRRRKRVEAVAVQKVM